MYLDGEVWYFPGCGTKKKYKNLRHATHVAKRRSNKSKGIEAYQCKFCGYWHIGHKRK